MKLIKNKILRYTSISLVLVACLTLASCEDTIDEFLGEQNLNEAISKFDDLEDTNATLNALYNSLLHHAYANITFHAMLSDEVVPRRSRISGGGNVRLSDLRTNNYNLDGSTGNLENNFAAQYTTIFLANQTIFGLEQIEAKIEESDREEWVYQMAQARFLRGMSHYYLHALYNDGNIILRDRFIASGSQTSADLSSSQEVIAHYVQDLEYALEHLKNPSELSEEELGRPTKGAAAMVLGNHYLYQSDYTMAQTYYEQVINDFGYTLADPSILFTTAGEFNSESIFEIAYDPDLDPNLSVWNESGPQNRMGRASSIIGASGDYMPASWLIYEFQNEQVDPLRPENTLVNPLDNSNITRIISRRASAMISSIKDEHTEFYTEPSVPFAFAGNFRLRPGGNAEAVISNFKKYTNHDIWANEQNPTALDQANRRSGKNLTLMRLSEAHINLAECLIELGDVQGALDQLNIIRSRWGLVLLGSNNGDTSSTYDEIDYTASSLMAHLMYKEKPLELATEGVAMRFIDLRRWGVGVQRYQDVFAKQFTYQDYTAQTFVNENNGDTVLIEDGIIVPVENIDPLDLDGPNDDINDDVSFYHSYPADVSNDFSRLQNGFPIPNVEILNNNNL